MILALLLSAAVSPLTQAPPAREAPPPAPPAAEAPAVAESAAVGDASSHIAAGLAAFKRRRLAAARDAFEQAVAADPQSPAAAFYLGYALYKLGEPGHRMNERKERAKELFAKAFTLDPKFAPVWGAK